MPDSRRELFRFAISLATVGSLPTRLLFAQHPQPQPVPSPNAPNPNFPQGMNGPGPTPSKDQKELDKQLQQEIRTDVDKIYSLVFQMKEELSFTSANSVLSVGFVKKAHEIEKLAKHVRDLAKG